MKSFKPIIAALALFAFIAVGVFGMMAMTGHHHEPGCPFMPGEQAICQMDAFDHITAWQSAFAATVPSLVILLIAAAVLYVAFRWLDHPPNVHDRIRIRTGNSRVELPSLYQELFARGILNPKIP